MVPNTRLSRFHFSFLKVQSGGTYEKVELELDQGNDFGIGDLADDQVCCLVCLGSPTASVAASLTLLLRGFVSCFQHLTSQPFQPFMNGDQVNEEEVEAIRKAATEFEEKAHKRVSMEMQVAQVEGVADNNVKSCRRPHEFMSLCVWLRLRLRKLV